MCKAELLTLAGKAIVQAVKLLASYATDILFSHPTKFVPVSKNVTNDHSVCTLFLTNVLLYCI
jgi:hypothetical protein